MKRKKQDAGKSCQPLISTSFCCKREKVASVSNEDFAGSSGLGADDKSEAEKRHLRAQEHWAKLRVYVRTIQLKQKFVDATRGKVEDKMLEGANEDEEAEEEDETYHSAQTKRTCTQMIIIHPQKSSFKTFWDTVLFMCLAVSLWMIPFTLAFDTESILDETRMVEFAFDIAFALNILLNFFTAYQQDIEWKMALGDIAKAYIKSYFVFDVLSTFPCLFTLEEQRFYKLKLLRFVHFRKFLQ